MLITYFYHPKFNSRSSVLLRKHSKFFKKSNGLRVKNKKSSFRGHRSSKTGASNYLTLQRRALYQDLFPAVTMP